MDYRTGKCSQCGAEYKVPASFAHNQARCKKCKGVVHLSAARGGAAPAASSGSAPTAMPAKRVVPKPASASTGAPEARKDQGPPAEPARPAARDAELEKSGAPERPRIQRVGPPPTPVAAPRPAVARAGKSDDSPEPEGRARRSERGRGPREKGAKKKPVVGLAAGVALVAAVAVMAFFREQIFGGGPDAGEGATPAADTTPAAGSTPVAATPTPGTDTLATPAQGSDSERVPLDPEAAPPVKAEPKGKDPSAIDLAAIPDFQPTTDTSAEEWSRMNEWMGQWMDIDAGAAGNRAKLELIKQSRKAVPSILNYFKKLDFATKEGRSNGDQCQKALQQICNGTNFDWRYADEAAGRPFDHPEDVWFCKKVVELWTGAWKQAEQDIKAWIRIAKLEEKDPAEAKRLLEMFGEQSAPQEGGAGDDLDVD